MKKLVFLLICLASFQNVKSQTDSTTTASKEDNTVYNSGGIEIKPEFKGGLNKFYEYIAKNYRTPDAPGINGQLMVSFVVEKDGSIDDIKVLKDLGYGTGAEAIRILKKCPKWTPAEQKGKKVRCTFMLPIRIQSP
jgi:protein TonB